MELRRDDLDWAATEGILTSDQAALAQRMKANGETAATICRTLGIGRTTLYRYLAESADDLSISRQPSA